MAARITVVAAVIRRNGKLLMTSRPLDKPPAGLEFPGGKVDPGENMAQALIRELKEELNVNVLPFDPIYHTQTEKIDLWFIRAGLPEDEIPVCCEGQQFFWVDPEDHQACQKLFSEIPLLPNDLKFWNFICRS